ncbi:MAG: hypothetical protein E7255_06200 [Lachnospiraceae bacterium]|nr:hypothetical protein [Lachnospiraceae bacterium]
MDRLTVTGTKFLTPAIASKQELIAEIERHQKYYDRLAEYEDTGLTPEEITSIIKEGVPSWIPKYLEYRDAEEQGLLIKLPCKVGDTVYWISHFKKGINSGTVNSIRISKFGFDLEVSNGNALFWREQEKIFFTREEAEKSIETN